MPKNLTVRLDDELAADTEALEGAECQSLNETVKLALREAVERRQKDPAFRRRIRQIIDEDRELLERLAMSKRAYYLLWQPSGSGGWRNRTPRRVPSPVFKTGRRPFSGTLQSGARKHPSAAATRSTG